MKKYAGLIISLILLLGGNSAYAEVNSYPFQFSGTSDTDYSFGDSVQWFKINATTTQAGITTIEPYLCRYLGTGVGTYYLEAFLNGTTTTSVASSTINASVVPVCSTSGYAYNGDYVQFQLNNTINFTSYPLYFSITAQGTDGTLYMRADLTTNQTPTLWGTNSVFPYVYTGKYQTPFIKLGSGLLPYNSTWDNLINTTMKNNLPECSISSLDGCISSAGIWLFYPNPQILNQFKNINLASTTPFGYGYDAYRAISGFQTSTSSSYKLTLDFSNLNSEFQAGALATNTVTVLDVCWVNNGLEEWGGNAYRDYIIPL